MLANRIALLKQEEMKTWKKIDDTKKRTNEILSLKKRNEERIQKVRGIRLTFCRKFKTTKCKMKAKETCLNKTTCWTSSGKMRNAKSRKQFSYLRRRKPSSLRSYAVRMNKKRDTWISKLNKKTEWKTKSSTNRNGWLKWRLMKIGVARSTA